MRKYFGIIPSWLAHNLILIRTIPNDAAASDEDDDGDDVDDVADFPAVFFLTFFLTGIMAGLHKLWTVLIS